MANVLPQNIVRHLREQGITKLYHFTDRSNIQSIINNGGLYSWRACENRGITIPRPGGSETSRSLDSYRGLSNYVRLCFTRNHPMMYVAKNDGRISNPVVLEIDLSVAGFDGTLFSDRNATKNGAKIAMGFDGLNNIHFSTVKQPNHFDLPDNEKEFYQAEVLVLEKVPIHCITNIDSFKPKPLPTRQATYQPSYKPTYHSSPIRLNPPVKEDKSPSSYRPSYSSSSSSSSSSTKRTEENGCLPWIIVGVIILVIAALAG